MPDENKDANVLSRTIASTATMKLANLPLLDLFYTPLEERFERITRLARRALDVPVAAITLINADTQWFKSVSGWVVSELPRSRSLCNLTLEKNDLNVIADMACDPRTADHPLVVSAPRFRFYGGHPLTDTSGLLGGTFCVFDVKPRHLSKAECQCLGDLAALAQREIADDQLRSVHASLTAKLSVARREAMIDPLTRLWNRRGATMLLESAVQRADRHAAPLGLALLDLDNFKQVNDTFGHHIGDEVLRRIGARLVASVRSEDLICRMGGDEFLLLVADADAETAATVAERVRRAINETPVPTRDRAIAMTASVGFTVREPRDEASVEALLERADDALLQAKGGGRNRVKRHRS
ncbi:MAG TPA: sensor domain-containing diguanylate cyclase [Gammaproteobacteria bacterium]